MKETGKESIVKYSRDDLNNFIEGATLSHNDGTPGLPLAVRFPGL